MAAAKTTQEGNEGFVSSSKGITLSVVSLAIWIFTLILFQMVAAVFGKQINYEAFCLFVSFILSIAAGIYISNRIYQRNDKWRMLAMCLNVLLIYSSANGIQAGRSYMVKQETQKNEVAVKELGLFSFLDARPWLPDATSKETIKSLTEKNLSLMGQTVELRKALTTNDQSGAIKTLTEENNKLHIENGQLKDQVNTLQLQINNGNTADQRMQHLQTENKNLLNELSAIKTKVANYNNLRNVWKNKEQTDEKFKVFVSKFRIGVNDYFKYDYLSELFNYDLSFK